MNTIKKFFIWLENLVENTALGKPSATIGSFLSICTLLWFSHLWSLKVHVTPRVIDLNLLSYIIVLAISMLSSIVYTLFVYAILYEAISIYAVAVVALVYLKRFYRFLVKKYKSRI